MPARSITLLDNLRISNGTQGLINFYREMLHCDPEKALSLINDPALQFSTLYALRAEFSGKKTRDFLDTGYIRALEMAEELSGKTPQRTEKEMRTAGSDAALLLEWMFRTGLDEDGLDIRYELLMDRIACLLVKSFRNHTILPELADLIFLRHKRGALIHDLAWVFFEACSFNSLAFVAYRFDSSDTRDVSLAGKLLDFIPGAGESSADIRESPGPGNFMTYGKAMSWLSENRPFLYYTGESLHSGSRPQHYRLSLAAKYLCTPVLPDTGEPSAQVRDNGQELLLTQFRGLDEPLQRQLADYSWSLYRWDNRQWNNWIALPLKDQMARLSYTSGGLT